MSYPASTKQVRLAATGNTTLYVDATNGSDTFGKGTAAQPFASIQAAFDHCKGLDGRSYNLQINVAAGTYAPFSVGSWVNSWGKVTVLGSIASPATRIITASGASTILAHFRQITVPFYFTGFRLYGGADYNGNLIVLDGCPMVYLCDESFLGALEFGDAFGAIAIQNGLCYCYVGGDVTILANAAIRFMIFSGPNSGVVDFYPDNFNAGAASTNFAWFVAGPQVTINAAPSAQALSGSITGTISRVSTFGFLNISNDFRDALVGAGMTAMADSGVSSGVSVVGGAACLGPRTKAQVAALEGVRKGSFAYCTDEAGGETIVFYDGTNWRRVADRAIMS